MHTNEDKKLLSIVINAVGNPTLDISVESGVVTLKGEVADDAQAMNIVKAIKNVPGVISVTNNLKVKGKRSGSIGEFVEDSAITAEVKAMIFAQKGLDSLDISVETIKGEVTLTGVVENHAQISLAEITARRGHGVKLVTNKLIAKK